MQTISVRRAWRTLFRTPVVTGVAITSLALGIGANAAIFSLFEQFLLRPLPVEAPDRLVNLAAPGPKPGSTSCNQAGTCEEVFSYPMFRDLERLQTPFTGMAAHRFFGANLVYAGETMAGEGMLVSGGYFGLLGLRPAMGRLIGPADDRVIGEAPVAVLSHDYWRTRVGADPAVLGDAIVVNGQPLTIIGVAPAGFRGTTLGATPHVFVPITLRALLQGGSGGFDDRRSYWAYVFARRAPGVSIAAARAAIDVPYRAILNDVEAPLQEGMSDPTLARFLAREVALADGAGGQSSLRVDARAPGALLLSVTGLVLLIACANIANLLLARAATRQGEMAVRLALGAGRGRLVGQLLLEACLLAVLGGLAALFVARWTLGLIAASLPAQMADGLPLALSGVAAAFTAALAIGTGLAFGLFPALQSTRPDLVTVLKRQAGQPAGSRAAARIRTALATLQIALSMALLVAAGLFIRSLYNVSRIELGLEVERLVTFAVSPERNGYAPARSRALFARLEETLAALPGVSGVTASRVPLLAGSSSGTDVGVERFDAGPDTDSGSRRNEVGPGYFATLGIPLLAGREFTLADDGDAPPVAVVNEAFTRKFALGRAAVGAWMGTGGRTGPLDIQIVGLVQDAKYSDVRREIPPQFFRPYRQNDGIGALTFYVRTAAAPDPLLAAIPRVVATLDPDLPVERLQTMAAQVRENVVADRFLTVLSAAFAMLATVLAAIGLYGVLAYAVAQRTRELGLRMALGADAGRVRRLVLRQVGWMTVVGGGVGLVLAIGLGRMAQSLLFELEGTDPVVFTAAAAALALVALGAGAVPAWRASRVDPMRALRVE